MRSSPLRLMIVDDSAAMRLALGVALDGLDIVDLVRAVDGGRAALAQARALKPDMFIVDLEMPDMDGIELTEALMKEHPEAINIVITAAGPSRTRACIESLGGTPVEFLLKPKSGISFTQWTESSLFPIIERYYRHPNGKNARQRGARSSAPRGEAVQRRTQTQERIASVRRKASPGLVLVGASTGGPGALRIFLQDLAISCGAPVVVVQHMPASFTPVLAKHLNSSLDWTVREAQGGETIGPGEVWIAPGNRHLTLQRHGRHWVTQLDVRPFLHGCRPAVDHLFSSVATQGPGRVDAVVLTGMGNDGRDGCRALVDDGGQDVRVFCQDEASSAVWGMPAAVVEAGLANCVAPISELGAMVGCSQ